MAVRVSPFVAKSAAAACARLRDLCAPKMSVDVLAGKFAVSRETMDSWFSGDMPYAAFLQLCAVAGVRVVDVMDYVNDRNHAAANPAPATATETPEPVSAPPAVTPPPTADAADDDVIDDTPGMDGDELGLEGDLDGGDEPPSVGEPSATAPSYGPKSVDMSSPSALPFGDDAYADAPTPDFLSAPMVDDSMSPADKALTSWPAIVAAFAADRGVDVRRMEKSLPKPSRNDDRVLGLRFPTAKSAESFTAKGFATALETVCADHGAPVAIDVES
jgi:hypothetical protein